MFDVTLSHSHNRRCDGASRRDFLRVGGLGVLGLTTAGLLARQSAMGAEATRKKPRAKSILLVYLGGGISHIDSFDPKPQTPEEIRGKFKPINTSAPGIQVAECMPGMAKVMDKICVVRSGAHDSISHEVASNWVLCGRFGSPFGDYPAIGAVVAHETGFSGKLPPYVAVPQNPAFSWELGKSAFLGGRFESFKAGDPNTDGYRVRDLGLAKPLAPKTIERRQSLLAAVDHLGATVRGNDQMATYDEFQQKAAEMVLSPAAQSAFDMEQEKPAVRDTYGRTTFGQSCLLARRLIERDVRFVTVSYTGWDHHAKIYPGFEKRMPSFDQGMSALIADMHQRGLLDDTMLVMLTDFGRSPKINKDKGRDHWSTAGCMLFAGAGVRPGTVVGATDHDGAYAVDRPVRPGDVAATIYTALGIDPRLELKTPEGRPVAVLNEGAMIDELYA